MPGQPIGELDILIKGDYSGLIADLNIAENLAKDAGAKISNSFNFSAVGQSLSSISGDLFKFGGILTAAVTAPLVGLAGLTSGFRDFELGMRQVTSLLGSTTDAEFRKLSQDTLDLANRLGVDAVKATKGLYEAISAGVPKENAISFLEVASKAAIAGLTNTKVAVDGLTTVLNAYRLEMGQAKDVSDAMFMAVNLGKFTFEQLANSMSRAMPIASQIGVSFKEVLAAATTLSKEGVPVSRAMTEISYAMNSLLNPTKAMSGLFEKIGVESGRSLIELRGFEGALNAVREAAGGNEQTLIKAMRSMEGFRAVMGLTGQNAKSAAEDLQAINGSADAMSKAFDEINKSGARGFESLEASLKVLGITIGQELAPSIAKIVTDSKPFIQFAIDAVKWFGDLDPTVKQLALGFAALAAAVGPLFIAGGMLAQGAASIISLNTALAATGGILGTVAPLLAAGGPIALGIAAIGAAAVATGIQIAELKAKWEDFDRTVRNKKILEAMNAGKTIEDLKKLGFTLDQIKDAVGNTGKAFGEAAKFTDEWGVKVKIGGDVADQAAPKILDLGTAHGKAGAAVKEHRDALEPLVTILDTTGVSAATLAGNVNLDAEAFAAAATTAIDLVDSGLDAFFSGLGEAVQWISDTLPQMTTELDATGAAAANLGGYAHVATVAVEAATEATEKASVSTKKLASEWDYTGHHVKDMVVEIRNVIDRDLSRGLADAILGVGNLGDAFKKLGRDVVDVVLNQIIKAAITPLLKQLDEVINKIPVLGGGKSTPSVPTGGGSSGGSGGSGAGGALSGGVLGWATLGVEVASAIAGYLQGRRMEQDIGRIEVTTRGMLNEALNLRRDEWTREEHLMLKLDDIWNEIRNVVSMLQLIGQFSFTGPGSARDASGNEIPEEQRKTAFQEATVKALQFSKATQDAADSSEAVAESFTGVSQAVERDLTPSIVALSDAVSRSNSSVAALPPLTDDFAEAVDSARSSAEAIAPALDQFSAGLVYQGKNLVSLGDSITRAMVQVGDTISTAQAQLLGVPVSNDPRGILGSPGGIIPQFAGGIDPMAASIGPTMPTGLSRISPPSTFAQGASVPVTVNATNPTNRQVTRGLVKGLQQAGVRVR